MITSQLIDIWLNFLALFEFVTIFRVQYEPIHKVFPLFNESAETDGVFKPLFMLLALLLIIVRINLSWDLRSSNLITQISSVRVTAMVHVAEAVYYTSSVFGQYGTLSLSKISLSKHSTILLIYGTIIFNALLFTFYYFQLQQELKDSTTVPKGIEGVVNKPKSESKKAK